MASALPIPRLLPRTRLPSLRQSPLRAPHLRPVPTAWARSKWTPTCRHMATAAADSSAATAPQKKVKLTADTYPELERDSRFAQVTPQDVAHFKSILKADTAIIDSVTNDNVADIEFYNQDWMGKYAGQTKLVLRPESTTQVSQVLKYCNEKRLAVVPQGGNTGLVGGSVPVFDEIVVSTQRMSKIRGFDAVSGILVADAGVILENADSFLAEKGYLFPLDLGAKGSCHIGGNVATNAGGLRLLRYGSLHGNVLGLEIVLPNGEIVDVLSGLRKDNTGYDFKQLFIGSEGTLGVITGVSIVCPQRPQAVNVAYLALENFEKLQQTFVQAKKNLGEILSAFELMDGLSQSLVQIAGNRAKRVLDTETPFYCLIETSGSNAEADKNKLEEFLEGLMEKELIEDGTIAQDQTQIQDLWSWREGIPEALTHWGGVYKYDVSIPLADLYKLVSDTRERLKHAGLLGEGDEYPVIDAVGYGHMGDSNLHLNVTTRRYDKEVEKQLEPWVYEWVAMKNGSISAEHGLGLAKKNFIGYSKNEGALRIMRQLKGMFDPNGIMNPYKYI